MCICYLTLPGRFVNYMINRVDKLIDRVEVLLRPIIEERRSMMEQYGEDWPDKPVSRILVLSELKLKPCRSERHVAVAHGHR